MTFVFSILCGCAIKRDAYSVPKVLLPEKFLKAESVLNPIPDPAAQGLQALQALSLGETLAEWWLLMGNPELNALIDRVIANNPDLRIATLRMAQLQARMDVTSASLFPEVNLPVQVKTEAPTIIGSNTAGKPIDSRRTYHASLRADWRPDLWGEFASQVDTAKLQLWRSTFQRDDLQRTVIANVVSAYVEYLSLNDRLRVAKENDLLVSELLASVATRLEIGDATAIDYEQQKTAVYQVRATIPVIQQQREVVLNRLSSLAGALPNHFRLSEQGLDSIRFPSVLPGVPTALLLRRPDVRAVEAQLLAADADIDLARARVMPPLDLTAQVGYGSQQFSDWFQPYNLAWSFIANLSANLFDAGKRSKEVEFSRAIHEEMIETYIRVVYEAAREVDKSLSDIKMTESRMSLQRISADAALQAWLFSQEAYRAGALDYLVVLDSERTFTKNEEEWITARQQRYQGVVSLFSALGGGVNPGIALPGEGERPLALKASSDYGALLTTSVSTNNTEKPATVDTRLEDDTAQRRIDFQPVGHAENTSSLTLAMSPHLVLRLPVRGIDWQQELWHEPGEHWLVEVTGLYERTTIAPAWRDLQARFALASDQVLVPHQLGLVTNEDKERAAWFRIYIARNPDQAAAEQLCKALQAKQQRCRVVWVRRTDDDDRQSLAPVFNEAMPLEAEAAPPSQQRVAP
ncbi:MAG: efflux transporter outer membrane subunit [Rhodoferax sp.]|nr:efflux transporter outer membrane subunit [Rhodoferax sp.]